VLFALNLIINSHSAYQTQSRIHSIQLLKLFLNRKTVLTLNNNNQTLFGLKAIMS